MSYTHYEVAQAFAKRQPFGRNGNPKRGHNVFIGNSGNVIYSYGGHFPMAYADDEKHLFIVNGDRYSHSTSQHQNDVRAAIRDMSTWSSIIIPFSTLEAAKVIPYGRMPNIDVIELGNEVDIRRCDTCNIDLDDYTEYWEHAQDATPRHKKWQRHLLAPSVFKSGKRYFLSGFDETARAWNGGYFLSELPHKCKSIVEAFEMLAPDSVKHAKEHGAAIKRQGDIFAVETDITTRKLHKKGTVLPKYVQKPLIGWNDEVLGYEPTDIPEDYAESSYIKNGRRPRLLKTNHFATEAVSVMERGKEVVYARGTLYHKPGWREADHRNIVLGKKWHKIYRNTALGSWSVDGRVD